MKIEIQCVGCGSIMRLDRTHLGKQARCPNCQALTTISEAPAEPANPFETPARQPSNFDSPMQDWQHQDRDFSEPHSASGPRSADAIALALGIFGIFLNIGCSCLVPIWIIGNCSGLVMAWKSTGSLRTAALTVNAIAIAIGILMFGMLLFWL